MGIKYFFSWLKSEFAQHMTHFKRGSVPNISIDTFMIDLNGVFHNSAAKVYKYGAYERKSLLGRPNSEKIDFVKLQTECFEDICRTIDDLVSVVKPKKALVLCIDGVAPLSKQNQQRQRRYRGIVEEKDKKHTNVFDPRSITPGTKWMDYLSKYIDWHIRKKITTDEHWGRLDVYFSNEKVPGEGEHKLINWIRKYGNDSDTYCINALDADLVMLSLGTRKENFYLLREELYDKSLDFTYVDIGQGIKKEISNNLLYWDGSDEEQIVLDFILILFLCGNDFLPNIPSISLIDKGLVTIIDMYKRSCAEKGHLVDQSGTINIDSFCHFLHCLGQTEKSLLEDKWSHRSDYFPDPLLDEHMIQMCDPETNTTIDTLDFDSYKEAFYKKKGILHLENACHAYVDGCAWVLKYYLFGVQDWSFMFPHNYSPFATDIARHLVTYRRKEDKNVPPISPFLQLLCVIPPKSSFLLPKPLDGVLLSKSFSQFFPDNFNINYEGKKKAWEGVVELPPVDVAILKKEMDRLSSLIDKVEFKRNIPGKNFVYKKTEFVSDVKSFYGNFKSTANVEPIDF